MNKTRLTIRELAWSIESLCAGAKPPTFHTLRRVIDVMDKEGRIVLERIGCYRTIAAPDVPLIVAELQRTGRLAPTEEAAECSL